jgi:hypothetical protein
MTDSTTTRGNAFRDHVAELLKLAGWVGDTERLIGGKKADLLMARSVYGRPWRLAIETKNYDSSLGMGELEKIIGGYFAAVQNHEINQLWIVSNYPLKGGKEFIDSIQWARHFTVEELLRNQMDFSSYLATLKFEHESSGLENYYISPQARLHSLQDSIFDLGEYLATWLNGTNCSPIAIVEGYGTGKTSVARHLAYALASERLTQNELSDFSHL